MRLIDADAVYEILESCEIKKDTYESLLNDWDHGYNCGIERAESEIECAPTIDAVPVVRCKDCKHRPYRDGDGMIDGDYVCPYLCDDPYYARMPEDDWFCHRGERRADG